MPVAALIAHAGVASTATAPESFVDIAWTTDPLNNTPAWEDLTADVRAASSSRGRSYEYDRVEAGTFNLTVSNRDSNYNPDNVSGDHYPNVKPTRRARWRATWAGITYPIVQAFTEGFPNAYPGGTDSLVAVKATDWFYPLNILKFTGASTTLSVAVTTTPAAGTSETITPVLVALPMPQAFPFTIQVGAAPDIERMEVTGAPSSSTWTVTRGADDTLPRTHPAATTILSTAIRFGQELSGTRINNCLDLLGIAAPDRAIDAGNAMIAASDNLAGTSILEHLLLIAECETGRLFAARDGTITFKERHNQFLAELTARATFGGPVGAGTPYGSGPYGSGPYGSDGLGDGEIPYLAATGNIVDQPDSKVFNRVRITIADGTIVEAVDQASIDAHFERTFEKTWPLASAIEAQDAADYLLSRLSVAQMRLPAITVTPAANPSIMWPVMLDAELGQRYRFKLTPPGGGTPTDTDVLIERVAHNATPGRWDVHLEMSEADTQTYWILEAAGHSELQETTRAAY